jgi:hypothetical protein
VGVGNWVLPFAGEMRWFGVELRFQATSPWKRTESLRFGVDLGVELVVVFLVHDVVEVR